MSWLWLALGCGPRPLEVLESPADPELPLPLVVAVHGFGDQPESLLALVERCDLPVRVVAPRGPTAVGDGFSWFETGFGPEGATFSGADVRRAADRLAATIDDLRRTRRVVGEVVLTGFSQGGILSFAVALLHPDSVGLAIPMAGASPDAFLPAAAPAGAPRILALHGTRDRVIHHDPTEALVDRLRATGWSAEFRSFDKVDHTITPAMRDAMCAAVREAIDLRVP